MRDEGKRMHFDLFYLTRRTIAMLIDVDATNEN